MQGRTWLVLGMLALLVSTGRAQTPTSAPTVCPAADQADLKTTLDALKQRIKDQDRRIADLESKQGNDEKVRREEIIAVLKDMKLIGDKRAEDIRAFWKDGLRFETNDGNFKLALNGRAFVDFDWLGGNKLGNAIKKEQRDGIEFRSVRLKASGDIYKDYFYMVELEFAHDVVLLKDVYMGMKNIPYVGNVRVGHFKEPFSLEDLSGDSVTTFMEYALPFALVPDRRIGIMANNTLFKERMTWAVGMFRNSDKPFVNDTTKATNASGDVQSDSGYNLAARVTGLPWYEDKGKELVHVGAAYAFQTSNDDKTVEYSAKPECDLASTWLDTKTPAGVNVPMEHVNLFGGELATVYHSFHAQGEVVAAQVNAANNQPSPCYKGAYVQAGYFLTGETRPYKTATGTFDRVRPLKNFREDGGLGAWELAARYSYLDLDSEGYGGTNRGELQDVTIGLNWYLNPSMRIMWNYIHASLDRPTVDASGGIFMMRFQVDF